MNNFSVNVNNNPSFGKNILTNVNLKQATTDGSFKFVKGMISELNKNDKSDELLLEGIKGSWEGKARFSRVIIKHFEDAKNSSKVYITELKDKCDSLKDNICCLMETTNPQAKPKRRRNFVIKFLQSAPDIANKGNKTPIKGAGELCIYEAVKTAQKEGYKRVKLLSVNNSFYDHLGFKRGLYYKEDSYSYSLPQKQFAEFLQKVEEKYNFKPTNN